jgi:hypothetical protein
VFISAELPDHITVGGGEVRPYVVVSAWHTGTGAIRAITTPITGHASRSPAESGCGPITDVVAG